MLSRSQSIHIFSIIVIVTFLLLAIEWNTTRAIYKYTYMAIEIEKTKAKLFNVERFAAQQHVSADEAYRYNIDHSINSLRTAYKNIAKQIGTSDDVLHVDYTLNEIDALRHNMLDLEFKKAILQKDMEGILPTASHAFVAAQKNLKNAQQKVLENIRRITGEILMLEGTGADGITKARVLIRLAPLSIVLIVGCAVTAIWSILYRTRHPLTAEQGGVAGNHKNLQVFVSLLGLPSRLRQAGRSRSRRGRAFSTSLPGLDDGR